LQQLYFNPNEVKKSTPRVAAMSAVPLSLSENILSDNIVMQCFALNGIVTDLLIGVIVNFFLSVFIRVRPCLSVAKMCLS
jgi:hypothetical protein